MTRTFAFLAVLATVLLAACSGPAVQPAPEPTAIPASTPAADNTIGDLTQPVVGDIAPTAEPTAEAAAKTFTVTVGTIEDVLTLQGEVAPQRFELSAAQDGIVTKILVRPGDLVEEGQLIAELDQGNLAGQLQQAELSLGQQRSTLDRQVAAAQLEVSQAEVDLQEAKDRLSQAKEPPTVLEIAEAQELVRQSQADLDQVRNNSSQVKNQALEELTAAANNLTILQQRAERIKSEIPETPDEDARKALRTELEQTEEAILTAESRVRSAQIDLDTARNNEVAQVKAGESNLALAQTRLAALLAGPDPVAIGDAQREVRRAELRLAQVKLQTAPDPALSAAVETSELEIALLREQVAERQISAPIAGEVGTVNVSLNQPVQPGTSLVSLINRSAIEVIAKAEPERDNLPLLQEGQPIEITFDRYPDQSFTGRMTQVSTPTDPVRVDQSYHLSFDAQGRTFDIGDTATAKLILGRKTDALLLPREALRFSRDRTSALLQTADGTRRVDVLTGITTADTVEILGGLAAGDVVVVTQ